MKKKFSLSGMPDFNPLQIKRREYALSVIKEGFDLFGFSPIQTSIVEKRDNLFGSYGDDGEKLIFQILRSGDYLNKEKDSGFPAKQGSCVLEASPPGSPATVPHRSRPCSRYQPR